ncbi:MAG: methyltransferase domain-containing protein [Chloroflexota bacterium]
MLSSSHCFDEYYFQHNCGEPYRRDEIWLRQFEGIAHKIVADFAPKTALDAGCAFGFLVESLRKRGVEAFGVDISEYAIGNVHESVKPYCWVGSVTEPFPQHYDLITCIEVLEHLPKPEAEKAIQNLCAHTSVVIFSSTPYDYKEATHINVQPVEYWVEQFSRHQFYRDMDADVSYITKWAVKFVKCDKTTSQLIRDYERKFWRLWSENVDLRQALSDREQIIRKLEQELASLEQPLEEENREENQDKASQGFSQKLIHWLRKFATSGEEKPQ